jgi:anti-anti-sigma factor
VGTLPGQASSDPAHQASRCPPAEREILDVRNTVTNPPLWKSHIHEQNDPRIVALTGELDLAAADDIRQILIGQLDRPETAAVIADLSEVTFLDSAALGALIGAFHHAADVDRRFAITGAVHGVQRIMQIAGVYDLLSEAA